MVLSQRSVRSAATRKLAVMSSDDRALPLPGIPAAASPLVQLAVCYDGCWYQNAARFFVRMRGAQLSVAGLHDAFRWHAAGVFGCPVQRVAVTQAHYVAGRDAGAPSDGWDQLLADHGIIRHDVPVTAGKGEVGADVELALTCYQIGWSGAARSRLRRCGEGRRAGGLR